MADVRHQDGMARRGTDSAVTAGQPDRTDRSEDEGPARYSSNVSSGAGQSKSQRIAKACDRCRKAKSKCEPSPNDGEPCKACAAMSGECTYTAPSFRRGPPKGYIQALEHRLHQVESVLAAIMSSNDPHIQAIIDELSQDELAAYILECVDSGPFGKTGREKQAIDTTKDNFFASIVSEQPPAKADSHRSRRQSRATRENVIESTFTSDQARTTRPTLAWQDRLSARLADLSLDLDRDERPSPEPQLTPQAAVGEGHEADDTTSEPPRTRQRLDTDTPLRRGTMATVRHMPSDQMPAEGRYALEDSAGAFGNLSIDENSEVRYHGNVAGLQLLAQADRSDGRNTEGIWLFPMAQVWPGNTSRMDDERAREVEESIHLPPVDMQTQLVRLFFTYVNPVLPVLDEESFMTQYNALNYGYRDLEEDLRATWREGASVRPERPQKLTKLLLLSCYAYAASHLDRLNKTDYATEYARGARAILDTVYHQGRSSTVQALILLGMREFGIGSLEEGWLHIGMAIRMALDLGLNRTPDKWMHGGRELFTDREKAIRKRIWWACCLADKYSALFLGRTTAIQEGDFSTPVPEVPSDDVEKMWQPCAPDILAGRIPPLPAAYGSYFRHVSLLAIITGEVLAKIYRVSGANTVPSGELREELHQRLTQWSLELPDHLNYNVASSKPCPPPHVLALHIQHQATLALIHRPFIPQGSELARASEGPSSDRDALSWESYDICQSAAIHVSSFAMLYHEKYDMRWAPPFLASCVQAAGIMNIMTLRYRPLDTRASMSLQKCITVLKGMEATWVSATRVKELLQNAKVYIDTTFAAASGTAGPAEDAPGNRSRQKQKRRAHVAFEQDGPYPSPLPSSSYSQSGHHPPVQGSATSSGMHAHPRLLPPSHTTGPCQGYQPGLRGGVPVPAGYIPGYDSWWPVLDQQDEGPPDRESPPGRPDGHGAPRVNVSGMGASAGPGMPSVTAFTFCTQQFSPDFLQAMRDPVLHFPSAFAHGQT